ncbi:isoprenylcysteine carboxylmethyltransferase family protein [bacterium]|nr:isoprenylcysteine carboxylmethyltransferase family protein [bacterium]
MTRWESLGGIFFRARSATPLILVFIVLFWPTSPELPFTILAASLVLVLAGETIRLRAVGTAGKRTRTRGTNVKELVTSASFAHVRNPLYIGNFLIALGLVVLSRVSWLLWVFPILFFFQYAAIVAWEERVLLNRFGAEYDSYRKRVPRWLPRIAAAQPQSSHEFSAEVAWQSERDSLRALIVLFAILVLKHVYWSGVFSWPALQLDRLLGG